MADPIALTFQDGPAGHALATAPRRRGRLVAMLLDAVRAGDEDGADAAAVALASDVLATEARLAASVLAGGPTALRDALTLAELLSPPSAAGGARGVG